MSNERKTGHELSFDDWHALAEHDPENFEATRRQCIDEFISRAPEAQQRRLRGLQWQIDQVRKLATNPMASCLAISNMMWDSLHRLNQHQQELLQVTPERITPRQTPPRAAAKVLAFPARHS